jgi:hypothetical protein
MEVFFAKCRYVLMSLSSSWEDQTKKLNLSAVPTIFTQANPPHETAPRHPLTRISLPANSAPDILKTKSIKQAKDDHSYAS